MLRPRPAVGGERQGGARRVGGGGHAVDRSCASRLHVRSAIAVDEAAGVEQAARVELRPSPGASARRRRAAGPRRAASASTPAGSAAGRGCPAPRRPRRAVLSASRPRARASSRRQRGRARCRSRRGRAAAGRPAAPPACRQNAGDGARQQVRLEATAGASAGAANSTSACHSGSPAAPARASTPRTPAGGHLLDELLHLPVDRLARCPRSRRRPPTARPAAPTPAARHGIARRPALSRSRHTGRVAAGVQPVEQRVQARRRRSRASAAPASSGSGRSLSVTWRDDAERAQGADVQLAQVVAGHVLDDPAAGLGLLALVVDGA